MDNDEQIELHLRQRPHHVINNSKDDIENSNNPVHSALYETTQDELDIQIRYYYNQLQQYGLVCKDNKKVAAKNLFINMICIFDKKPTTFYILPANHIYIELLILNQNKPQYANAIFSKNISTGDNELVLVEPSAIDSLVNILAQDINAMLERSRNDKIKNNNTSNGSGIGLEFDEVVIIGKDIDDGGEKEKRH